MHTQLISMPETMIHARLVARDNRFVVTARTEKGLLQAHCNNSGSMLGLLKPDSEILLSLASNPKRKLPYTLEAVHCFGGWVGVNTQTPNVMIAAAFHAGLLPGAGDYATFQREVKRKHSRFDGLLTGDSAPPLWIEAKNVTLVEDDIAAFPDAVTKRGQKHLLELMDIVDSGERAAMFFLVQRPDGKCFGPAEYVDPEFARLFWQAVDTGVEVWPFRAEVSPEGIGLGPRLPLAPR
ncbi:MAG: DNA/RNA nuclease SfsA [Desulfovibrio sp.]|nr:MAG: DNA/RNA nuclease SfsA [Desulfovibrio sp.]